MHTFFEIMLNAWWQGIVLTLLVWLVLRDLPRVSAATRLAIWQVTLAAVLMLPLLQQIPVPSWPSRVVAPAPAAAPAIVEASEAAIPWVAPGAPAKRPRPVVELEEDGPAAMLGLALLLALVQMLRLAAGYAGLRRLKRNSQPSGVPLPLTLPRPVNVLISDRIGMPMAVGYRRPAILLPRNLTELLTPAELQHILLHESAHLLRRDDWAALAERVVRAIFFFQPAVYWIGGQIERERELACDDWVIAQSGEAKPYASSLARLAELGSPKRVPILATGAGRPKQIFARLETLLDRTRNRIPFVSEPVVAAAGLVLLLAVAQGAHFNRFFGITNYHSRWVESDGGRRLEITLLGEVRFTEDDQDVSSMSPGAKLVVEQAEGWRVRSIEFEADHTGRISRRYFSNGIARPFDTDAQRFAAKVLPAWVREQGHNVPERLGRLVDNKGAEGAMDEIRSIRGDGVKRAYLEELVAHTPLSEGQLARALKIAGEIQSDGDKRRLFERVGDRYANRGLDSQVLGFVDTINSGDDRHRLLTEAIERGSLGETSLPRLIRSVSRISSDGVKADLLRRVAQSNRKGRLPDAFFEAAAAIQSNGDRQRLLSAVLALQGDDPASSARVLRAASSMQSDGDKAKIMIEASRGFAGGADTLREASLLLKSIHSDGDRRRCLNALLEADGKNPATLREVLLQTISIHSDGDKSQVLVKAAGSFPELEPVRQAFFASVNSIQSSGDQRRVLMAVLARNDLDKETLREVSRSARQISSDGDQAAVLKAVSERQ